MKPDTWRTAIMIGSPIPKVALLNIRPDDPGKLCAHCYGVVGDKLDRAAYDLTLMLERPGAHALPVPARGWPPPQIASLIGGARAAGLGSLGKNQLVIHPQYGPTLRFAAVLTSMSLPSAAPEPRDVCGDCSLCVT